MNSLVDAFICYGRADSKTFAAKLSDRLNATGLKVWFDFQDIPVGVNFHNEIKAGIEKAHNVLFIVSPSSVHSPYCLTEIDYAIKHGKRIIPLIHVEEIDQATWQQRHPNGTPAMWEAYQASGKHSIYSQMHPEIAKINWVFFREGLDEYEQAFSKVLEIVDRQKPYVHQHTYLLNRALEWEGNQKQSRYLLVQEERLKAVEWLSVRFQDGQFPCMPTSLQCEFISESTKNANNRMTQAFLCNAEEDAEAMQWVRRILWRAGSTVWSSQTDIQTGEDFQDAIDRGIEHADNIIYLLSPESLASRYCQHEIDYALTLNKRIITIQVRPVEPTQIPANLRYLQYIDLTVGSPETHYDQCEKQLLKTLHQESGYYEDHKQLLARALKWERQGRNPSILLRGYNLSRAEAWLKLARQDSRHPPLALQEEFIAQSLAQPPASSFNAFICHSSVDADFARQLNDALQMQGKTTWFAQDSIATGTALEEESDRGIETSENFLLILSSQSLSAANHQHELTYAQTLHKRIIPILYRDVPEEAIPASLADLNWIDFRRHNGDFLPNFSELIRLMDRDPDYVQTHTRLLVRALEWEQGNRDDSLLLRGKELAKTVQWLQDCQDKEPQPSDVQIQFVQASQELPFRKIRLRSVVYTGAIATAVVAVVRVLGLMVPMELNAYDHLLRLRPDDDPDPRMLVVMVDEESSTWLRERMKDGTYTPSIGTVPDQALSEALTILSSYNPRIIGLDFYRDFKAEESLADQLSQTDNLIALCKANFDGNGVEKAPEISIDRTGFNDFVDDGQQFIRRHYLMQSPDPAFCNTPEAFSLLMARRYLETEGIDFTSPVFERSNGALAYQTNGMRLGSRVVPQLRFGNGPFAIDPALLEGYQTLINFRVKNRDPQQFADRIKLSDVLTREIEGDRIRDRIVLIGYTDRADRNADYWNTPYGEVPGVILQGQMTSQLISAALDGRPFIRWWPAPINLLWTLAWALVGGVVFWWFKRPGWLAAAVLGSLLMLYGLCSILLTSAAYWVPLISPALALLLAGGGVALLNQRLRRV